MMKLYHFICSITICLSVFAITDCYALYSQADISSYPRDGTVNLKDFSVFSKSWSSSSEEPEFNHTCDFNQDNVINTEDLGVLCLDWLRDDGIAYYWAAPVSCGNGSGSSPENAAAYTSTIFWNTIQNILQSNDVNVWLLDGNYSTGPLDLTRKGNPLHKLQVMAVNRYGVVLNYNGTYQAILKGAQNIRLYGIKFTGDVIAFATYCQPDSRMPARNIEYDYCWFIGQTKSVYGAIGILNGARDIKVQRCIFDTVGVNTGSHMIYVSHDVVNAQISQCTFKDCSGDYVRFLDDSEYCEVDGCSFESTPATWCSDGIHIAHTRQPFVHIPVWNVPSGGNQFFGAYFKITNNEFVYPSNTGEKQAIQFNSEGADPIGYYTALSPEDVETLSSLGTNWRRGFFDNAMGLEYENIHIYNNTFHNEDYEVSYNYNANGGMPYRDWEGTIDITDVPNSDSNVGLGLLPKLRNADFEARGDHLRMWFTKGEDLLWHPGKDGSRNAARFNVGTNQKIFQWISNPESIWTMEFCFAVGSNFTGTGFRFKTDIYNDEINWYCLSVAIDDQGRVGVYNGSTFVPLTELGEIQFSVDNNSNGYYTDSGDSLYWYRMKISGDYSGSTPYVNIYLSEANTDKLTRSAVNQTKFAGNVPTGSRPGTLLFENYQAPAVIDNIMWQ